MSSHAALDRMAPDAAAAVAFVSIMNGVFLNVMPEITAAFALAALSHIDERVRYDQLPADLIHFGLLKSGHSCIDKLRMFNQERAAIIRSPEAAAEVYDIVRRELLADARCVDGIVALLSEFRKRGIKTFTTSVIPQVQLTRQMQDSFAGREILPFLEGALGAQASYTKLLGHLRLIAERHPEVRKFYLLFDAPAEVRMGADVRREFDVRVVGFAAPLAADQVSLAFNKGIEILKRSSLSKSVGSNVIPNLSSAFLSLPSSESLVRQLFEAGADHVISCSARNCFADVAEDLASMKMD